MTSLSPELAGAAPEVVRPRIAVIAPVAANVAFILELTLVPLLLAGMQVQLDLSIGDLAWVFNIYGFAVAAGVLLGGWFGDAIGPKRVFGSGVALFAIGSLVVAVAESYGSVLVGRAIQGFGAGVFSPLVPLLLTQAFPDRPGRALIVWGSVGGYVAAFAPLLYGRIVGEETAGVAFVLLAILASIALLASSQASKQDRHVRRSRSIRSLAPLLRTPRLWATFLYVLCSYGAITYYLFRLPVWLSGNEVNAASVGLVLSIVWLTFSVSSTALRNMVDGPWVRLVMIAAPILIAAALPLAFFNQSLLLLGTSAAFIGAGLACSNAPSTQMILRHAPEGMSALSTCLDITFARIGGIVTVAFLAGAGLVTAAAVIAVICFVAALCAAVSTSVSKAD